MDYDKVLAHIISLPFSALIFHNLFCFGLLAYIDKPISPEHTLRKINDTQTCSTHCDLPCHYISAYIYSIPIMASNNSLKNSIGKEQCNGVADKLNNAKELIYILSSPTCFKNA